MTDPSTLSNAALNRRVAELMDCIGDTLEGSTRSISKERPIFVTTSGNLRHWFKHRDWSPAESIADAWELEESVPEDERDSYKSELSKVVFCANRRVNTWDLIHATPRQRTEAWVMWREGEE